MPSCQCRLKAWGGRGRGDDDLSYRTFIETLYLGEGPSTGMIVILLRSENCRFLWHLGCLGWRVNIIVMQVLLRIPYKAKPDKKNKQTMLILIRKSLYFWSYFIVCFSIVSPLGWMKPEPRSDWDIPFPLIQKSPGVNGVDHTSPTILSLPL